MRCRLAAGAQMCLVAWIIWSVTLWVAPRLTGWFYGARQRFEMLDGTGQRFDIFQMLNSTGQRLQVFRDGLQRLHLSTLQRLCFCFV